MTGGRYEHRLYQHLGHGFGSGEQRHWAQDQGRPTQWASTICRGQLCDAARGSAEDWVRTLGVAAFGPLAFANRGSGANRFQYIPMGDPTSLGAFAGLGTTTAKSTLVRRDPEK